jgi:hypothetical protein
VRHAKASNNTLTLSFPKGTNTILTKRVAGVFGQTGDSTAVRVDVSRLCDKEAVAQCFSSDWTLFARLEPRANVTLPLRQRLFFKAVNELTPLANLSASPVWTQQFHPWELINVIDSASRGVYYFHVLSPMGFSGAHEFAFVGQPFSVALVLQRCHYLTNHRAAQVLLHAAGDGEAADSGMSHYWIYDRLLPLPYERDSANSYFGARVMLRNELATILRICREEKSTFATQTCLIDREFWKRAAHQFVGKLFPLQLAQYFETSGIVRDCRSAAEQIGVANARHLPVALATATCASDMCESYCLRGVTGVLVQRVFESNTVVPGASVSAKSADANVRIEVAHVCASLINDAELPACLFAVGIALATLGVEPKFANALCDGLQKYEQALVPSECKQGFAFGVAHAVIAAQIRASAHRPPTPGVDPTPVNVAELCPISLMPGVDLKNSPAYECARTAGRVLFESLESLVDATEACRTFLPTTYRHGGAPMALDALVKACEKGVAAAEGAREKAQYDAKELVPALRALTSDFYVMGYGQNVVPTLETVRVSWLSFIVDAPAQAAQSIFSLSETRVIDNQALRQHVLQIYPYYSQFYGSNDAAFQQRNLAGQPLRFYVAYEGHGAFWHDAEVEINDAVPEFHLSLEAPSTSAPTPAPTPAPPPPPPTTTRTKRPKTTTTDPPTTTTTTTTAMTTTTATSTEAATTTATASSGARTALVADEVFAAKSSGDASNDMVIPFIVAVSVCGLIVAAVRWRSGAAGKSLAQEQ